MLFYRLSRPLPLLLGLVSLTCAAAADLMAGLSIEPAMMDWDMPMSVLCDRRMCCVLFCCCAMLSLMLSALPDGEEST